MARRRTKKQPRHTPPHATARGLLFACLALGMVIAQLFGVGHLVFVSHAICEHGALLHAGHTEATDTAGPADADAKQVSSAVPGRGDGEHEHCNPFAREHATLAVTPSFAAPELLQASPPAWHAGSPVPLGAISLLALAPKGSPPPRPFVS